ncbi:MAG: hypothetical protein J5876_00320 [Lachnospiraceae bacterium]|nr:hypothetical protein [Lachnospiraceae bacterium]MBO4462063.1 hypothetical protein [Lachnospiraceae bacterium]
MKEYTVFMAIMDFVPVVIFGIAAIILQRALYTRMSKGAFALLAAGTIDIILAGAMKALYKLLYALKVCDFEVLSNLFFPLQAIGFLLAGLAIVAMLTHKQGETAYSVAPMAFSGTMIFVLMMTLGAVMLEGGLMVLAVRKKSTLAVLLLLISTVCLLSMGYISSRDFNAAYWNWIAEGINIAGQLCFLLATLKIKDIL